MPYTGEFLIILACIGWALGFYGVIEIEYDGEWFKRFWR